MSIERVGIWIRVSTEMQAATDSPEHHLYRAYLPKRKPFVFSPTRQVCKKEKSPRVSRGGKHLQRDV